MNATSWNLVCFFLFYFWVSLITFFERLADEDVLVILVFSSRYYYTFIKDYIVLLLRFINY